jgi:hypothetical protein
LRNYLSQLDIPFEDIQRYLVYRIRGTAEPPVPPPSAPVHEPPVHAEQIEASAIPEVKVHVLLMILGASPIQTVQLDPHTIGSTE